MKPRPLIPLLSDDHRNENFATNLASNISKYHHNSDKTMNRAPIASLDIVFRLFNGWVTQDIKREIFSTNPWILAGKQLRRYKVSGKKFGGR